MIKEAIVKIVDKQYLTYAEAYQVMNEIMSGETSQVQNAAFLAALSTKSTKAETIDESSGCAAAMREHALQVEHDMDENLFGHVLPSSSTRDPLSRALHFSSPVTYSSSYLGMVFDNQSEENRRSMNNRGNERRNEKPELKSASHPAFPMSPKRQSRCIQGIVT